MNMQILFRIFLLCTLPILFCSSVIHRHDVYFENDSAEMNVNVQKIVSTIYAKMPGNAFQYIIPLGKNENRYDRELNELRYTRANNIAAHIKNTGHAKTEIRIDTLYNNYYNIAEYAVGIKKPADDLQHYYSDLSKLSHFRKQLFTISNHKNVTISGKKGTEITFYANTLQCENGKDIRGNITLTLTEYYETADMIKARLTTTSGPTLLETGGMLYITASCESCKGSKVVLKPGAYYSASMPVAEKKPGMGLFIGKKEEDTGIIDWQIPDYSFEEIEVLREEWNEDFYEDEWGVETKEVHKLFETLQIADFGWINLDRFIDISTPTRLALSLQTDWKKKDVFLVFKNIRSILSLPVDANGMYVADNLPYGEEATILAFTIVNEKTYFNTIDIVTGTTYQYNMELKEQSRPKLEILLAKM